MLPSLLLNHLSQSRSPSFLYQDSISSYDISCSLQDYYDMCSISKGLAFQPLIPELE